MVCSRKDALKDLTGVLDQNLINNAIRQIDLSLKTPNWIKANQRRVGLAPNIRSPGLGEGDPIQLYWQVLVKLRMGYHEAREIARQYEQAGWSKVILYDKTYQSNTEESWIFEFYD